MMKDLGARAFNYGYASPVLMVATYNDDGSVNVMNLHECTRTNAGHLALCIGKPKKTHENIEKRGAFTLTLATKEMMAEVDYMGTVSGYRVPDKFEKAGMKAVKSDLFLKKGYSVFLVDQPRRGAAGATEQIVNDPGDVANGKFKVGEQAWYTHFRIGRVAPERYEDSQFPEGDEALEEFFCQMTPNTGNYDEPLFGKALTAVLKDVQTMTGRKSIYVTASGTGSEQNNGAVITNEEKKQKSPLWGYFADFAILDPDLTKTVPMKQVISGAFDTLSHCMETYFGHPHTCNLSDRINEAVQRSVIKNMKALIANPDDDFARSELMWASAMGENGILKLGKMTDFQCHMIEHQLGAYTDCNHGQGLAVLHPILYRHIYKSAEEKFRRWAQEVWLVQDADEGIDFLADFIREVGLPTTFTEMGIILDDDTIRAIATSTIITPGCCKQLTPNEIVEILKECK